MNTEYIYKRMYLYLFNAVTDALELMDRQPGLAAKKLRQAQQHVEEMYISEGERATGLRLVKNACSEQNLSEKQD